MFATRFSARPLVARVCVCCGAKIVAGRCSTLRAARALIARQNANRCHCGDVGGGDCAHSHARDAAWDVVSAHASSSTHTREQRVALCAGW